MGLFERYLTLWVALGIGAGVGLGLLAPGAFHFIAGLELAHVNLVVAVFIWVMIYPMMIQIDWHAVKDVGKTTLAAAISVALAQRGFPVHLTTSGPAAHLAETQVKCI